MDILCSLAASDRNAAEVSGGLDVVCTLLRNINSSPEDVRFRRIRKANRRIAPLLGHEEEALLRAAGFEDDGDDAFVCPGSAGNCAAVPASLLEVLQLAEVAQAVLAKHAEAAKDSAAKSEEGDEEFWPLYQDPAVANTLECALLDQAAQRSADATQAEKRRRLEDEAAAVRSPAHWREAIAGRSWLLLHGTCGGDNGLLETWLDSGAGHRELAHKLCTLQESSAKWYGEGARRYCERWRAEVLQKYGPRGSIAAAGDGSSEDPVFQGLRATFESELQQMQEALFEYPEKPGAPPKLFRSATQSLCARPDAPEAAAAAAAAVSAEVAGPAETLATAVGAGTPTLAPHKLACPAEVAECELVLASRPGATASSAVVVALDEL